MSRSSFMKLCDMMKDVMSPAPDDVAVRPAIPLEMRVAIAVYRLGSCGEYRLIANQFGVHKSTVMKFVRMFCQGMVTQVAHLLIKVPSLEEALVIAQRFEARYHIPQIIGFWSASCKVPGSAHDATVLRHSDLFKKSHLLPKHVRHIGGMPVNFFLLGDPAYPLMEWLMKGYPHTTGITPQEESFNFYLSSARTSVEIAFGRLKARWRVLLKRSDFHYTFTPLVVVTCCALHNFCEREEEILHSTWMAEATSLQTSTPQPASRPYPPSRSTDEAVRRTLTEYMASNFPLRRQCECPTYTTYSVWVFGIFAGFLPVKFYLSNQRTEGVAENDDVEVVR
ncbi:Protein ALP1-like [Merluccius polli]|uniref:Protein ALP1-like n=1 Tax=Merluccius polli TaxID=89951 RepID=A0AA47P7P0_MERPO|nr:Protein ALP1-like [Merluccius polli]